jgi:hypothetical protein
MDIFNADELAQVLLQRRAKKDLQLWSIKKPQRATLRHDFETSDSLKPNREKETERQEEEYKSRCTEKNYEGEVRDTLFLKGEGTSFY